MKKIICLLLIVFSVTFSAVPVYAADMADKQKTQETMGPLFTYIWTLTPGLGINSSGKAICIGDVTIYNNSYRTVLTVQLQKSTGSNWSPIKTWTGSGIGTTGVLIEEDYYVARGTYRVCVTSKVYDTSDKLLESQSLYSVTVTY